MFSNNSNNENLVDASKQMPQVGESPVTSPMSNLNSPPSSYAPNKKLECTQCLHVPRSANVDLIALMEGKDDFRISGFVSERYFKSGDSFSKVKGMIDKMRGIIKV